MVLFSLPEGVFWWFSAVRKDRKIKRKKRKEGRKDREKRYKRWGEKDENKESTKRACNILHHSIINQCLTAMT